MLVLNIVDAQLLIDLIEIFNQGLQLTTSVSVLSFIQI